jgi:BlaI family penicillinase repressor
MTLRNNSSRPITELQQAILNFIWSQGSATAEQVREALLPAHPLKDSSVRTLLRRLEEAKVPSRSVAARAVQHIIDRFCSGSVEQFLVGMVDEKVLSIDEIRRLARKVRGQK